MVFTVLLWLTLSIQICALGLNITGVYLVYKFGIKRTHQNVLILHLSIFEVLISVSGSVNLIKVLLGNKGDNLQKLSNISLISLRLPICMAIAVLTVDRLYAAKYLLRYKRLFSRERVKRMLLATWVMWIVNLSILLLLSSASFLYWYEVVIFPTLDCMLLALVAYTYCTLFRIIRRRCTTLREISTSTNQTAHGTQRFFRVSMLITFSFVLLVTVPDTVVSFLAHFASATVAKTANHSGYVLNSLYILMLPLTYIFMQRNIKGILMEKIRSCCCRRTRISDSSTNAGVIIINQVEQTV